MTTSPSLADRAPELRGSMAMDDHEAVAGDQRTTRDLRSRLAVALWLGLVIATLLLGGGVRANKGAHIGAAPFVGHWSLVAGWRVLPTLVVGTVALVYGPALARRLRWRTMLAASGIATVIWSVALAWTDRAHSLTAPLRTRYEYLAAVPRVRSVSGFLHGFVAAVPSYPTHVKSHPPGMVLVLWGLDQLGLTGAGPATVLLLGVGALSGVAALVALRELCEETTARHAAPFVALAPAAVFLATSSDAFFAGVSAWAITLLVLATGRRGRTSVLLAVAGGLLFAATVFLSYGLALLALIPAAVCITRRRLDVAAVAVAVLGVVTLGFAGGGFWWFDGLGAARTAYAQGQSSIRPYGYFLVANLAVLAVLVGPATAAGLARLRDRRAWLLVGGAIVAIALANVSGLSKGEVERIWLPFAPWIALSCCTLVGRSRPWLAANLGTGLALQLLLRSPW